MGRRRAIKDTEENREALRTMTVRAAAAHFGVCTKTVVLARRRFGLAHQRAASASVEQARPLGHCEVLVTIYNALDERGRRAVLEAALAQLTVGCRT